MTEFSFLGLFTTWVMSDGQPRSLFTLLLFYFILFLVTEVVLWFKWNAKGKMVENESFYFDCLK